MADKSFRLKVFLSAIVGLFIGATIVPVWLAIWHNVPAAAQEIFYKELQMNVKGSAVPAELSRNAFLLLMAQNEIDCLPFLLFCSCVGPAMLIMRRSASKT